MDLGGCHLVLALLGIVGMANSDNAPNFVCDPSDRIQRCSDRCEKTLQVDTNSVINTGDDGRERCKRGCRFYMIFRLIDDSRLLDLNSSVDACKSSCKESYIWPGDAVACNAGCDMNSQLRDETLQVADVSDVWPVLRYTTVDRGGSFDAETMRVKFLQGEIPEPDDALAFEPGAPGQVAIIKLPLHIPEVKVRTLPVASSNTKDGASVGPAVGGDWFARGGGPVGAGGVISRVMPHCLPAVLLLMAIFFAFWFGLYVDNPSSKYQVEKKCSGEESGGGEAPPCPEKVPLV